MNNVVIVAAKRTPIGTFGGGLASLTAPELGATALLEVIKSAKIPMDLVDEVVMGNVLSAGVGQAPARQAALKAGLSERTPATTVNKVCSSGLKAVMMGFDQIRLGDAEVVAAGGMESMSNVPYYLPKQRFGSKYGHVEAQDGIVRDGLWDVYNGYMMGDAAEHCARECAIGRESQDQYAISSYKRALEAYELDYFRDELIKIHVKGRRGETIEITRDEELDRVNFDKIPGLKPVFQADGTVTAANASSNNDGAAAVLLMSEDKAAELGMRPLARIISHANAALKPEWFTTAPSEAMPKAIAKAGLSIQDMDLFEINEAFAGQAVACIKDLELDVEKVNVNGGAVGLGHPLAATGTRLVLTLAHELKRCGGRYGVATACIGGGQGIAMVIESI